MNHSEGNTMNHTEGNMAADCSVFNFIAWGLVGGALCIFGFCGNILSLMAFQRDKRSSTTSLLQSLAVSDFLLLASVFITDSVPYVCAFVKGCVNPWLSWPYIRYIWIMTPIAHMCSIWLVVLIALNRYWAVCHAVEMVHVWNNRRTPMYIGIVVALVISFNMPRFFEYQIITYQRHTIDSDNNTVSEWVLHENRTEFGSRESYKVVYKVLLVNMVLVLVPIVLLIAFTITILVVLQDTRKRVKKSVPNEQKSANGSVKSKRQRTPRSPKTRNSQEITFILILVVVVAIICQAPLCVFHFLRYTGNHQCGHIVFYLDNISKLLVNVNSSVNFIIYCLFSHKFRRMLLSSLRCSLCGQSVRNTLDGYTSMWGGRTTVAVNTNQRFVTEAINNPVNEQGSPRSSSNNSLIANESNGHCSQMEARNIHANTADVTKTANSESDDADHISCRCRVRDNFRINAVAIVENSFSNGECKCTESDDVILSNSINIHNTDMSSANIDHMSRGFGDTEQNTIEPALPGNGARHGQMNQAVSPNVPNQTSEDQSQLQSENITLKDTLVSNEDCITPLDKEVCELDTIQPPDTPTLPQDFRELIMPLRETVC